MRNRLSVLVLPLCFNVIAVWANAQVSAPAADSHPFATKFQPYLAAHTMAGAVFLVATKDKILDEETVGFADVETQKPMSPDNEFAIASMTKPMTGVALMMLVDEGKVSIDDPVEKYLPEFKGQTVKGPNGTLVPPTHPILIREILSHTSGLPNVPDRVTEPIAKRTETFGKTPLDFQPGTKFVYVNAGIDTAARIIEVVSGEPYEKFLQEHLLTPLGMSDTTFWPDAGQLTRLVSFYKATPDNKGLAKQVSPNVPIPGKPRIYPLAAGGLSSTAADLLKFCRMMLQGGVYEGKRYISEDSLAAMTKTHTTQATGGSYGLTWMINPKGFFHNGAFKTHMGIMPHEGLVEIFLVQQEGAWPNGATGKNDLVNVFSQTVEDVFGKSQTTASTAPTP